MIQAFHTNWTKPYFARQGSLCTAYTIDAAELLTTALSALMWQRENGSISMLCDQIAAEYYRSRGLDFLWNGGIHALCHTIKSVSSMTQGVPNVRRA